MKEGLKNYHSPEQIAGRLKRASQESLSHVNEHTNGLLRQFFPKGTNFKILKPEEVERAVNLINNRPRKCLDYRTPNEVFYKGRSDSDAIQT